MLMIVDRSETIPVPEICRQSVKCYGAAARRQLRTGDRIHMTTDRAAVELVLGFRPGTDLLLIETGAAERLLTTEDDGCVVLVDRRGRRIVLEGVKLSELQTGDIHINAF
jgi:hypothetical protein